MIIINVNLKRLKMLYINSNNIIYLYFNEIDHYDLLKKIET